MVENRLAAPGECHASYVAITSISGDGVAVPIFAGLAVITLFSELCILFVEK